MRLRLLPNGSRRAHDCPIHLLSKVVILLRFLLLSYKRVRPTVNPLASNEIGVDLLFGLCIDLARLDDWHVI